MSVLWPSPFEKGGAGGGFSAWHSRSACAFVALSACMAWHVSATPALLPVPDPSLFGMEAAVQEQLSEGLAELRALSSSDVAGGELAEAYGGMGQIYLAYDLVAPAAACLRNAHLLAPADFRWPYLLGALYQTERRLDEALASYQAALALGPEDSAPQKLEPAARLSGPTPPREDPVLAGSVRLFAALIRTGNVHLARDEPELARQHFERAVALGGPRAAALAGLGKAAAALGEHQAALEHFEAALAEQPEASALHYPLAITYRELGRIDDARRHLAERGDVEAPFPDPLAQSLLRLATGAGVHLMYGNRALRQGNLEAAIKRFRQAVEANPRSAPAQQSLGGALGRQGDAEGAVRHYSASLALEPENPALHYNLGTVLVGQGEDRRAIRHFRAALELAPDYHNARYNLATALAGIGSFQQAETHYRTLLEIDATDRGTRYYLAQTLRQLDRHREAAEILATLVAENPGRVRARLALGGALAGDDADGAISQYRAVLDLEPDHTGALRALAPLLARQGLYDQAAKRYGELIELEPGDESVRFGQATALMLAESYSHARKRLEEGLEAFPGSASLAHALARLLAACPDPSVRDGERAYQLAVSLFRSLKNPLYAETAAMALAEQGRFDEAVGWQRRLILEAERAARGASGDALLGRLRERLALYERGEPCRAPWLAQILDL